MNKFQKHIDAYNALILSAKDVVNKALAAHGTISFRPGKLTEVSFNSMSNGAVLYDIGTIYKDGEIICPEEGAKWKGDLNEADHDDIICAYMGLNELSDYGWCEVAGVINKSPSKYINLYRKIEKNAHVDIVKMSKSMPIKDLKEIAVYEYDAGDYFYLSGPCMLNHHSVTFANGNYVSLDNFTLDDLITILKHVK